jgi:hypothetical protein
MAEKPTLNEIYDKLIEAGDLPLFEALWKSYKEETGLQGWLKNIPDDKLVPISNNLVAWLDLATEYTPDDKSDFFLAAFNSICMHDGDFGKKVNYKKIYEQAKRISGMLFGEIFVRLGIGEVHFTKEPYDLKKTSVYTKKLTLDCINESFIFSCKSFPLLYALWSTHKDGKFTREFLIRIDDKLLIDTLSEYHLRKNEHEQWSLNLQFTLMIFYLLYGMSDKKLKLEDTTQAFWSYLHLEFVIRCGSDIKSFPDNAWAVSAELGDGPDLINNDFVKKNNALAVAQKIKEHFGIDKLN